MASVTNNRAVIRWVVDVDQLWPQKSSSATRPLTNHWAPNEAVQAALNRLSQDEKANIATVARQGFETWVRTFDVVFSDRELDDIVNFVPPESCDPQAEIAAKLRHFNVHWAMREAYMKMTED